MAGNVVKNVAKPKKKTQTPKAMQTYAVKYSAVIMVDAESKEEALDIADEMMCDMVESDELGMDDIFGIETINTKIHDASDGSCSCGCGGDCGDEDSDDGTADSDDEG